MTRIEQREHERFPLDRQPDAELFLRTATAHHPIRVVRDVSNSGIRVVVEQNLSVAERVAIEYCDPKLKLEVNGIVAWCAPREEAAAPGDYDVGIELFSPMMLAAVLQKHAH